MRPGVWGLEIRRFRNSEPEARIVVRFTQDEDTRPAVSGGQFQPKFDQACRAASAPEIRQNRNRCQSQRAKWCAHPRKRQVPDDVCILICNERNHCIAVGAKSVHKVGLSWPGKASSVKRVNRLPIPGSLWADIHGIVAS